MNTKSSGNLIALSLFLLALPWFLELLHIFVPPSLLSFAEFIKPSFYEYLSSSLALLTFLLITYFSARISSRLRLPFKHTNFFQAKRGMLSGCIQLLPIFTIIDLLFLFSSLRIGFTNSLLAFRSNEISIGYFGYFILYYYPIVLAITWQRNSRLVNTLCIVLIAFTNLLTGFRTLLISSLILIVVYNFESFKNISRPIKIIIIFSSVLLFIVYGTFRESVEVGDAVIMDTGKTFLDSLNRSFPIRYMVVALRQDVFATFTDLFNLFASPISVLINKADGLYDVDQAAAVYERVVRPYLIWRGTPGYAATGFSIHVVPFSFLFFGAIGLVFFAILIGTSLGLGVNLSRYRGVLPRISGAFLITFALSSSESFQSGYSSLYYRFLFLIPLVFFSALSPRSSTS